MQLKAIYLMPDCAINGTFREGDHRVSSITFWDREKHSTIKAIEQKNGEVFLLMPDGSQHEIRYHAIKSVLRVPDEVKQTEPVRVGGDKQVRA